MSKITLEKYSDKSLAVFGEDTKTHKDDLKGFGGKFNGSLKCGAGWIFTLSNKDKLVEFMKKVGGTVNLDGVKTESKVEPSKDMRRPFEPKKSLFTSMDEAVDNLSVFLKLLSTQDKLELQSKIFLAIHQSMLENVKNQVEPPVEPYSSPFKTDPVNNTEIEFLDEEPDSPMVSLLSKKFAKGAPKPAQKNTVPMIKKVVKPSFTPAITSDEEDDE